MPIALYLCGARRIITCDLNRYLDKRLSLDTVRYITNNAERVRALFPFVAPGLLDERIANLRSVTSIDELFRLTGIEYYAPYDCARTNFDDGSIDLHYSYTVFEHIAAPVLEAILREANRLLSDRGVALHHIDLGDHFAQVDSSITPANFLQFSDKDWQTYSETPWSYHNRLREDDYRVLYEKASHEILLWKPYIDQASLNSLKGGFPLAAEFRGKPPELLSVAILDVVSRPRRPRNT
jgi:SAM-dependent methyltransferase